MSFSIRRSEDSIHAGALEAWREAEDDVGDRWRQFLAADREGRRFAFAAYVAALDREAAAAEDLTAVVPVDRAA